ncbi:MAG TPA: oligosaccharide repeat unit polymerase [Arcobacter sp.]|nr:oligosaccharide repeat unit polymerase [Arcobacter sp.]
MNLVMYSLIINMMICLYLAYRIYQSTNDALHYGIIFLLLFIITYPLKIYITISYGINVLNVDEVPVNGYWFTIFISNTGAIIFIFPIFIFKKIIVKSNQSLEIQNRILNKKSMFLWLLLLAISIVFLSYGFDAIKAVFSFSQQEMANRITERTGERVGAGLNAVLRSVGITLIYIYIMKISDNFSYFSKIKKLLLLVILLVSSYLLLAVSGSKVMALFPWVVFLLYYNRLKLRKNMHGISVKLLIYVGTLSLFSIALLGYIRGFGTIVSEYGYSATYLAFRQLTNAFDAGDNLLLLLHRMENIMFGEIYFHTTIDYLTSWIPRFIWADKPLVRGNQYIMQYIFPERFGGHMGEAISSSLHGQLLLDGGFFYMIFMIFIMGLLYRYLYYLFIRKNNFFLHIIYIWFTINIFGLLRSGFGIFSGFINFSFGMVIVYIFYNILKKKYSTKDKYKKESY